MTKHAVRHLGFVILSSFGFWISDFVLPPSPLLHQFPQYIEVSLGVAEDFFGQGVQGRLALELVPHCPIVATS